MRYSNRDRAYLKYNLNVSQFYLDIHFKIILVENDSKK